MCPDPGRGPVSWLDGGGHEKKTPARSKTGRAMACKLVVCAPSSSCRGSVTSTPRATSAARCLNAVLRPIPPRAAMFAAGFGSGGRDRFDTDAPLYRFLKQAIALRRAHPTLSRGRPTVLRSFCTTRTLFRRKSNTRW